MHFCVPQLANQPVIDLSLVAVKSIRTHSSASGLTHHQLPKRRKTCTTRCSELALAHQAAFRHCTQTLLRMAAETVYSISPLPQPLPSHFHRHHRLCHLFDSARRGTTRHRGFPNLKHRNKGKSQLFRTRSETITQPIPLLHPTDVISVSQVLDAPSLQDDFYLNLVDWSSNNILAVALGSAVYLWNAYTGMVTQCFSSEHSVSAVAWVQKGTHLAIGLSSGKVEIFDTNPCKRVRTMSGHDNRVGALCWNGCMLTSGSRDHKILNRDTTSPSQFTSVLSGHKQEVCGLKWSPDGTHLASGGNDNKLLLWSAARQNTFYRKYSEHTAAVKAIAWSPHEAGILVSGGGTADRTLRFWNINHATSFKSIDSGSQVCNLGWSQNVNEIVSTHGYSQNQIVLWRYPSMARIATLTGHTTRVLFLAISPDGQNIVTGAGDENLRFWHVWPAKKADNENRDVRGTLSTIGSQIR
eukprot:c9798_g1_i1.p1 GENE.c9798_g1_i1~~c9798_g1_i1.p1  ORF type:complete len:468 (+),score=90.42 c9798_g1_i1:188-1591(+)